MPQNCIPNPMNKNTNVSGTDSLFPDDFQDETPKAFSNENVKERETLSNIIPEGTTAEDNNDDQERYSPTPYTDYNECPKGEYKTREKPKLMGHVKYVHDKVNDNDCPNCECKANNQGSLRIHV